MERQTVRFDYGENLLKSLPDGSIFFAESDDDYFSLYYLQNVERRRPDIRMIPSFVLFEDWGVEQVERLRPPVGSTASGMSFPDPISRIVFASSEIVATSRGKSVCATSYFNGAFHRYYLARHPSLSARKSGVVLLLDDALSARGPFLPVSALRVRGPGENPAPRRPTLDGIRDVYRAAGLVP
jgi:hypothetical protein